jgi:hypothetical protein
MRGASGDRSDLLLTVRKANNDHSYFGLSCDSSSQPTQIMAPAPQRRDQMDLGRPRGRTDERRRRSALNYGPRKLGHSHGRRERDVYKYYLRCMEGPKVRSSK